MSEDTNKLFYELLKSNFYGRTLYSQIENIEHNKRINYLYDALFLLDEKKINYWVNMILNKERVFKFVERLENRRDLFFNPLGFDDDWFEINTDEELRIEYKKSIKRFEKQCKNMIDRVNSTSLNQSRQSQQIELLESSKVAKAKHGTMEVLTNETYYNILEKCTIEAFDTLKLKEYYPKSIKAVWDVSTLTIKGDGVPTDADNELYRKIYIKENMRVTFLMALDRYWEDFEIKYSMTRFFFYKKCYQSLLFKKTSESPLLNKPDFGFDINAEPCELTFIWAMRSDIEARSKGEPQHPEPAKPKKDYKEEIWFKIGLLFATGEIEILSKKHNRNATQIAVELKNKSYRPYISESLNNSTQTDKNIFSKPDKVTKIADHCKENDIKMCEDFLSKLNQSKPE